MEKLAGLFKYRPDPKLYLLILHGVGALRNRRAAAVVKLGAPKAS
jgi:hypothetical protein